MLRLLFTLFLIPFLTVSAVAQRCFKAYIGDQEVTEICVNTPVQFKDCSGLSFDTEFYDIDNANGQFDSGQANNLSTRFTFTTPGTYVVGQLLTVDNSSLSVWPQTYVVKATPPPAFTAVQCGPNQVKVTIQDATYDSLYLFLNNGSRQAVTTNQIITLATPGSPYQLKLQGKYRNGNCGGELSQNITPPAPAAPVTITRVQVRPGGVLAFRFSGLQSGYNYQLEAQNGITFSLKSQVSFRGSAEDSLILTGQDTSQPGCFRLVALDDCSQVQGTPSPVICSTVLAVAAQNNQNVITWPAYAGNTPSGSGFEYALYRRENSAGARTLLTPAGFQANTYTDLQVTCGVNYCYELELTEANGGFSFSEKACLSAISTDIPPAPVLLTSFNPQNILTGTVTLPANATLKSLQVLKSAGGLAFTNFATAPEPAFRDPDKTFKEIKPCYQVTFVNDCGNTSEISNTSCPVILTSKVDRIKRTVTLNWTEYAGFAPGTETYELELLDANFNVSAAQPLTSLFTTEEKLSDSDQILRYRIKVSSNGQVSYSNLETIIQEVRIIVPNAFSPNGDGLNDIFEVKGRFQNNFSLLILNRWGEIVFESRDPKQGWNGLVNGKPAPVGVYAYRLQATDEQGRKYETTGTLTLLK